MKQQKIAGTTDQFLVSSNNYEDDDCLVCELMRTAEKEGREPTVEEIEIAMLKANEGISKLEK